MKEIEKIDKKIISLLYKRLDVIQCNLYNKNIDANRENMEIINNIINKRKEWAFKYRINPIFIGEVFHKIVDHSIENRKNKYILEKEFNINNVEILMINKFELNDILDLQILCYQSEAINCNDFKIPPLNYDIIKLEEEFAEKIFFKAVFKDKIIGSVRGNYRGNSAYIEKLMVHPDFQNLGIGKKIILFFEQYFNKCKYYKLYTSNKSKINIDFYKKMGYKKYKENKVNNFYRIVFMKKFNKFILIQ